MAMKSSHHQAGSFSFSDDGHDRDLRNLDCRRRPLLDDFFNKGGVVLLLRRRGPDTGGGFLDNKDDDGEPLLCL